MTLGKAIGLGGVLACLLGVAAPAFAQTAAFAPNRIARDWATVPAVVQIDTTADLFAIGDVHGDCDRLVKLLIGARIVESDIESDAASATKHWSAGKSILVFTGDLIDKGPKGPAVIVLVNRLREEAARAGGRVVVLAGNHEVDLLRNPESEKSREFALQLKAVGLDAKSIAACTGELGAFFCGLPFAARVNDWFFSHAGNTGGRGMGQLISDLQSGVDRDGFDTSQLTDANSLVQARLGEQGAGGKSWFETAGREQGGEQTLAAYAAALGVAHIVQGHQHNAVRFPDGKRRKPGEIYQWRGRLFLIDVGMSRDIDESRGAVLRIRPGEASVICPDGRTTKLWEKRDETKKASKGVRCPAGLANGGRR